MPCLLAELLFEHGLLLDTTALASVATIGFIFGRRSRRVAKVNDVTLLIELAGAQTAAKELEQAVRRARSEAGGCLRRLGAFQSAIGRMQRGGADASWPSLRAEADALVGPVMRLSAALSAACDDLRRRQAQLTAYASERVDRETGLCNRRSLSEHVEALTAACAGGESRLSLVLLRATACREDAEAAADVLRSTSRLLDQNVRRQDVTAWLGGELFAVLMPRTALAAAGDVRERLVRLAGECIDCTLSSSVVEAAAGDTADTLLRRAELALSAERSPAALVGAC